MLKEIQKTYDAPLVLVTDYRVFNLTKYDIRVRMATIDEEIRPTDPTQGLTLLTELT